VDLLRQILLNTNFIFIFIPFILFLYLYRFYRFICIPPKVLVFFIIFRVFIHTFYVVCLGTALIGHGGGASQLAARKNKGHIINCCIFMPWQLFLYTYFNYFLFSFIILVYLFCNVLSCVKKKMYNLGYCLSTGGPASAIKSPCFKSLQSAIQIEFIKFNS